MGAYHNLSEKLQQRIIEDRKEHRANPYAFSEEPVSYTHLTLPTNSLV